MRVALIKPPTSGGTLGLDMMVMVEPLGLTCLGGALEQDGHDCTIIDARIDGEQRTMAKTLAFEPQMVGIQCNFTSERFQARKMAREVKRQLPEAFVVVGGHDASRDPVWFQDPCFDAVAQGDGEDVFPPLVEAVDHGTDLRRAPGLVLNTPAGQRHTGPPPDRHHLDEMPLPARHLTDHYADHYYQQFKRPTALLETARGCPFKCNFCSVWKFHESTFRQKSAERVIQELSQIRVENVFITDDIFWMDVRRCTELGKAIAAAGIRKTFFVQTRTDIVCKFPHLIEQWRDLGYLTVFLGVEKVDDAGLTSVNKSNSAENNVRALEILKELGVGYSCNFIVDPDWEREDFDRLKRWMDRHTTYNAGFTVLTPLPGTDLWDTDKEKVATYDWRIYDLFHTVLPTKLPIDEFYREVAGLWDWSRQVFYRHRGKARFYLQVVLGLVTGKITWTAMRKGFDMARALSDPESFMELHREREGVAESREAAA